MQPRSLTKRQLAFVPRQVGDISNEDDEWKANRQYGIVIDAGSSGSRVYVYSWKDHDYVRSTTSAEELKGSIPIVERGDPLGLKWTRREEPGTLKANVKRNIKAQVATVARYFIVWQQTAGSRRASATATRLCERSRA